MQGRRLFLAIQLRIFARKPARRASMNWAWRVVSPDDNPHYKPKTATGLSLSELHALRSSKQKIFAGVQATNVNNEIQSVRHGIGYSQLDRRMARAAKRSLTRCRFP